MLLIASYNIQGISGTSDGACGNVSSLIWLPGSQVLLQVLVLRCPAFFSTEMHTGRQDEVVSPSRRGKNKPCDLRTGFTQ